MANLHRTTRAKQQAEAEAMASRCGYKRGGAIASAKESDEFTTPATKMKPPERKSGGAVGGDPPTVTLDKRARGGRTGTKVNVIVHSGGGGDQGNPQALQAAEQAGMKKGAMMAVAAIGQKLQGAGAGGPPMAGPPPGGPPMGGPAPGGPVPAPVMPPMRASGGRIAAGSGSGQGRLNKAAAAGGPDKVKVRAYERKRRGGPVGD